MQISKEMMISAAKAYHSVAFGLHPHALRKALEAVLSATEPMAWLVKRYDLDGVLLDTELSFVRPTIKSTCRTDMVPLYSAPPAPSLAVKALKWRKYGNQHGTGWQGMGAIGYLQYIVDRGPDGEEGWFWGDRGFDTEDEAKAAVQSNYDACIMSALSAQVQDVAEVDADTEDADCCIACEAPLVAGDLVYWDVSDTGYLHAGCCGPEREGYVNEDGEPLKDGDPIPQPFPYKPDRAAGYIYTGGEKE